MLLEKWLQSLWYFCLWIGTADTLTFQQFWTSDCDLGICCRRHWKCLCMKCGAQTDLVTGKLLLYCFWIVCKILGWLCSVLLNVTEPVIIQMLKDHCFAFDCPKYIAYIGNIKTQGGLCSKVFDLNVLKILKIYFSWKLKMFCNHLAWAYITTVSKFKLEGKLRGRVRVESKNR